MSLARRTPRLLGVALLWSVSFGPAVLPVAADDQVNANQPDEVSLVMAARNARSERQLRRMGKRPTPENMRALQRTRIKLINDPRKPGGVIAIDLHDLDVLESHGLDALLLEELGEYLEKAETAADGARRARTRAKQVADEAEATAAEAQRLNPGYMAHFPDRSAIWAYVSYRKQDGSRYHGKWRASRDHGYRAHGLGTLDAAGGARYRGEFAEGHPSGAGILLTDWRRYEGTMEAGQPSGVGVETKSHGGVFLGQFVRGVADGNGILRHASHSYTGQIADGRRHGFGREEYGNGRVRQGLWLDDRLVFQLETSRRPSPRQPGAGIVAWARAE